MSQAIYKWHGDLFCPGCIIDTMMRYHPWGNANLEGEAGKHEQQLDLIAKRLKIDRSTAGDDFPVRQTDIVGGFCKTCMNWFI